MSSSSSSSAFKTDAESLRRQRIKPSSIPLNSPSRHPFDSSKWGRICQFLISEGYLDKNSIVEPLEASADDLLVVHTEAYLNSLKNSANVAMIAEVPPVAILPNWLVQMKVLNPFRRQVGGTILAAKLAKEQGWAINVGGGFHHCCSGRGGGFCAYADISLCIHFAFVRLNISRVMIIDLDAHQGNGHEMDFAGDGRVYIMDMYNPEIYPFDMTARNYINQKVEVVTGTTTDEYLKKLDKALQVASGNFAPELIVYNAGTDILDGDPLGRLKISPDGVVQRDEKVFRFAHQRSIPLVMVTSGSVSSNLYIYAFMTPLSREPSIDSDPLPCLVSLLIDYVPLLDISYSKQFILLDTWFYCFRWLYEKQCQSHSRFHNKPLKERLDRYKQSTRKKINDVRPICCYTCTKSMMKASSSEELQGMNSACLLSFLLKREGLLICASLRNVRWASFQMLRRSDSSSISFDLIITFFFVSLFCLASFSLAQQQQFAELDRFDDGANASVSNASSIIKPKDGTFAAIIDRALEKEFPENEQNEVSDDAGSLNNSVAEQQAVLETVARVKPKKNDTKEEKSFQLHDVFNLENDNRAGDTPMLIDRKDNVFIISNFKSKYPVLQLDLRLISDLVITGYLLAGSLIGPGGFNFVSEMVQVGTVAQFGVIFLLFALGLEFSIAKLRVVRAVAVLGGLLQIVLFMCLCGITASLCGGRLSEGVFVGVFLSMSSTAVVLILLMEKNSNNMLHGQVTIGTLILQDCAVGLLFALLLVLGGTSGILQGVISMTKLLVMLVAFLAVLSILSRTCLPWLLKLMISLSSQTNELYQLASVAFCLLVAWIEPVRNFFAALFLASIGMLIHVHFLWNHVDILLASVILVITIKTITIALVVKGFGYNNKTSLLVRFYLMYIDYVRFFLMYLIEF
ncbi:hypothetical protein REPUB_Repub18cG0137900 [Reevesia pubescens]